MFHVLFIFKHYLFKFLYVFSSHFLCANLKKEVLKTSSNKAVRIQVQSQASIVPLKYFIGFLSMFFNL